MAKSAVFKVFMNIIIKKCSVQFSLQNNFKNYLFKPNISDLITEPKFSSRLE